MTCSGPIRWKSGVGLRPRVPSDGANRKCHHRAHIESESDRARGALVGVQQSSGLTGRT